MPWERLVAVLATLVARICDVPLESKILHRTLGWLRFLLVARTAGRTASGRLLFRWLVARTAGRTASGGLLFRWLVASTAGSAASSGLFTLFQHSLCAMHKTEIYSFHTNDSF